MHVQQVSSTLAVAALSITLGYWLGSGKFGPQGPVAQASTAQPTPALTNKEESTIAAETPALEESDDEVSDDESDYGAVDGLEKIQAEGLEPCKMVLVVRTDLGMTKGKIAAQCCHAALACYKTMVASNIPLLKHWEYTGQAKIALQISSEEDLLLLEATAQSLNLCARSIQDAGRTQIAAGSRTVLGIGPAPVRLINEVTGHLKLL